MKRIVHARAVILVLLVLVLGINRWYSYRNITRLSDAITQVARTHHVLDLISEVMMVVVDAETGQRGFLLTNDEAFLEPYHAAIARSESLLSTLAVETKDHPGQQERLVKLRELVQARLTRLGKSITQPDPTLEGVEALRIIRRGKEQMDAIRGLVAEMKGEESRLLTERNAHSHRTYQIAVWANFLTALGALMVIGAFAVFVHSSLAGSQRHAAAMQRANEELHDEMRERNRVEQALRESERIYRAIGESIDYGVWLCEPDGRNTYASPSFLRLVGLTQQQCSDFGWSASLHPDEAERTIAAWKQCVKTGTMWDKEHSFRGSDGQWHSVLARGVPVYDDNGELLCWAGINLDISRMKRTEQQLQLARSELECRIEERTNELKRVNEELQREVRQHALAMERLREHAADLEQADRTIRQSLIEKEVLLKEVHHRVKNNLQVISSLLYLQSQQTSDELSIEMFNESQQRVRSMALVHERLYRSPDLAQVDFADYIGCLTDSLFGSNRADSDRIRVVVDVQHARLSIDTAVPCGLLVNELISNSLKHAFPANEIGCINVGLHRVTDDEVLLSVRDDGVGLPVSIDPATSPTFGMQVIMALVEQLHGSLEVERSGGTTFLIRFPNAERVPVAQG
jgi:PAS domain S-box-containing protein